MSWEVIEPAGTGNKRLFGRQPIVLGDALGNLLAGLYVGRLNVDGSYTQLPIAQEILIMRCHVVLYEVSIAFDLAHEIGLIAPDVEIAVANLTVIVGADCVITLANVDHYMHVIRQVGDSHIDDVNGDFDVAFVRRSKIWFINLEVLASRSGECFEIVMQQLPEVGHHQRKVIIVFVMSNGRQ